MVPNHLRITVDFSFRLINLLRRNNISIGTQQTILCIRSIYQFETIDLKRLLTIYKLTLINRKQDINRLYKLFQQLLKSYRNPRSGKENIPENANDHHAAKMNVQLPNPIEGEGYEAEEAETAGYSTREIVNHKDFRFLPKEDYASAMAELKRIARKYAVISKRKMKQAKHGGKIDLRRSIRNNVKFGGEMIDWQYKKRIPTHSRFAVIVDVSGSMEIYSHFLLRFLHLLHRHHWIKIETFVFSTELQRLTQYFRSKDFGRVLNNISHHFSGWSGGTKIGQNIETLNKMYDTVITPKTNVIIMSDGWDTGDMELLDREMSILHNRAKSIIWMNPLKGDPSYEPLALGMAKSLPYCDQFISCHNINSLKGLAQLLSQ